MLTLIVDNGKKCFSGVQKQLSNSYPELEIIDIMAPGEDAKTAIKNLNFDLVILEFKHCQNCNLLNEPISHVFQTIFLAGCREYAYDAIKFQPSGYIIAPVEDKELNLAVEIAIERQRLMKKDFLKPSSNVKEISKGIPYDIVGIPTMEGIDFIHIEDIIRCEGLQKCTRIVTHDRSDIISSYNIGEFRKLFNNHGFFAPHKSHLVNLQHVRKFYKEGTIIMNDKSYVPVSRRRRREFLKQLKHL